MFVIDLNYIAPLSELDAQMPAHMKFLKECYKSNLFLTSGRKVPRTGGIIIATGKSKAAIEEVMREDPFVKNKLAHFVVTEFMTSQMHGEFRKMMEKVG